MLIKVISINQIVSKIVSVLLSVKMDIPFDANFNPNLTYSEEENKEEKSVATVRSLRVPIKSGDPTWYRIEILLTKKTNYAVMSVRDHRRLHIRVTVTLNLRQDDFATTLLYVALTPTKQQYNIEATALWCRNTIRVMLHSHNSHAI